MNIVADIDLLQDAITHAHYRRESFLTLIQSAIGQRIKLHQDITGLSILLLGGIVALFNLNDESFIKTRWLLYSAGGFLIIAITICLYARVKLLQHLQNVIAEIEGQAANVYGAVKALRTLIVRTDPPVTDGERAIAIDKLVQAENTHAVLTNLSKMAEFGHKWAAIIFGLALLQIALALIVHIS